MVRVPSSDRRRTAIRPRMKNVTAKRSHERRIPGSSTLPDGRRSLGWVTCGDEHDGPGTLPARRRRWSSRRTTVVRWYYPSPATGSLSGARLAVQADRRLAGQQGRELAASADPPFHPVETRVGDRDQLRRRPSIGREGRRADGDPDRG